MGQKSSPVGLRLQINRTWDSRWYAEGQDYGRLLLEDAVPEDLRSKIGTLDSKGVKSLAVALAENHPEQYRESMKRISKVANDAGYESGGFSFGPEDMAIGPA
ncbi:MAG: hypothetical protein V4499_11425, partial [Pseudomonadota bacterium]